MHSQCLGRAANIYSDSVQGTFGPLSLCFNPFASFILPCACIQPQHLFEAGNGIEMHGSSFRHVLFHIGVTCDWDHMIFSTPGMQHAVHRCTSAPGVKRLLDSCWDGQEHISNLKKNIDVSTPNMASYSNAPGQRLEGSVHQRLLTIHTAPLGFVCHTRESADGDGV